MSNPAVSRLVDAATAIAAICAVGLSGFIVYERIAESDRSVRRQADERVDDWQNYVQQGNAKGTLSGENVMVVFGDYECPWCKRFEAHVAALLREPSLDLKVLYRHFPLPYHENAITAARMVECAAAQGEFSDMHDHLFSTDDLSSVSPSAAFTIAGYSTEADLLSCMVGNAVGDRLEEDAAAVSKLELTGTPSVLVNGILLARPDSSSIRAMLMKQGALP